MDNKYHIRKLLFGVLALLTVVSLSLVLAAHLAPSDHEQSSTYSLRFYGHGYGDIDRVKIQIDDPNNSNPGPPTDIGATDFTLEFWMKAYDAENNPSQQVGCGQQNYSVINGNLVFDRDIWDSQGHKYAISLDQGGHVAFGVAQPDPDLRTICGSTNVLDGQWHHIAVQRRYSDGWMWVYVDGNLEAQADGPNGDISYPDNATPNYRGPQFCRGPNGSWGGYCLNESYIVIGAEKHDYDQDNGSLGDPLYPSYSGWLDEVRLSTVIRYTGNFTPPRQPFVPDGATAALYHLDEGPAGACTGLVLDSSGAVGGPSPGECRYGGAEPAGPVYSTDSPFTSGANTLTPAPSATWTRSPTLTPTRIPTQTNTPTPMSTPTPPQPCRLSAAKSGNDVVLSWTIDPGATAYRVYRGTTPYFVPGTPYAITTGLTYTDTGVIGDPAINYSYQVAAAHLFGETFCNNRVGEFDIALMAGSIRGPALNDLAIALDVSAVITDAESLADWIEGEGGVPFATVRQLLKWDASSQTFRAWDHRLGFGDNFAIATGDFILATLNRDAPPVTTLVGRVPEPGEVSFRLSPGTARGCALNFISLPFDQETLTTADQLSDDIGIADITVIQALDWDATRQNPLIWFNAFGLGNNFLTTIGSPYIVCLSNTGVPPTWP